MPSEAFIEATRALADNAFPPKESGVFLDSILDSSTQALDPDRIASKLATWGEKTPYFIHGIKEHLQTPPQEEVHSLLSVTHLLVLDSIAVLTDHHQEAIRALSGEHVHPFEKAVFVWKSASDALSSGGEHRDSWPLRNLFDKETTVNCLPSAWLAWALAGRLFGNWDGLGFLLGKIDYQNREVRHLELITQGTYAQSPWHLETYTGVGVQTPWSLLSEDCFYNERQPRPLTLPAPLASAARFPVEAHMVDPFQTLSFAHTYLTGLSTANEAAQQLLLNTAQKIGAIQPLW